MIDDQRHFLSLLRQPPARLTAEQVAWTLNCAAHDIPVLVAAGLLDPLGSPAPNAVKYFATVELLALANDRAWLAQATAALQGYWHNKNRRRTQASPPRSDATPALASPARTRTHIKTVSPLHP